MDNLDIRKSLIPYNLRKMTEWSLIVRDGFQEYVQGKQTMKTALVNMVASLALRVRQLEQDLSEAHIINCHGKSGCDKEVVK